MIKLKETKKQYPEEFFDFDYKYDGKGNIKKKELTNQSQQNEKAENGGSNNQGSSFAFEPLARRSCDLARNLKSKEAPNIKDKYGRNTEIHIRVAEPKRRHENIVGETAKAKSSADTQSKKGEKNE